MRVKLCPTGWGGGRLVAGVLAGALAVFAAGDARADDFFADDFERHSMQSQPAGWSEKRIETAAPRGRIVRGAPVPPSFAIAPDPLSSGNQVLLVSRAGTIVMLGGRTFAGSTHYSGRFMRESSGARIGVMVLSSHAIADLPLEPRVWHRFEVHAEGGVVRSRFWRDGDPKPAAYATESRVDLREGEIGLWAGAGPVYFDDIIVQSGSPPAGTPVADTTPPRIVILAPVPGSCLSVTQLEVRGNAFDEALAGVRVIAGDRAPVLATRSGDAWSALLDLDERKHTLRIEAFDAAGNTSGASLTVTIDRTSPTVAITESARPLDGAAFNRTVTPFVSAEPGATLNLTLDGGPYVIGTAIESERDHRLEASGVDCAGNTTTVAARFTIDRTPPQLGAVSPAAGAVVGAIPQIAGVASPDAKTIRVQPFDLTFPIANGRFSLASLPLTEGRNELLFVITDRAGNESEVRYEVEVKLGAPEVTIVESGAAIPPDAVFNREITPVIRVSDPGATVSASLDDAPYASGTPIGTDGGHVLVVTATNSVGHKSAPATAAFTIDRAAPEIRITQPAENALVHSTDVEVRGTVDDADTVFVDGIAAPVSGGAFAARVPVDVGPTLIVATARDSAGNVAAARVAITRSAERPGLIITAPADGSVTNRRSTTVIGQVLTPVSTSRVTIAGVDVPVDAAGVFRKSGVSLTEGENVIAASVISASGVTNQTTVRITADRTPPHVRLFESSRPLAEGARFPQRAAVSAEAGDGAGPATLQLLIDGVAATQPATVGAAGGHTAVAIGVDRAGNETRVERTFFIGAGGGGACVLGAFDPPDGAVVAAQRVTLAGRSGGAAAVTVNGIAALVSGGGFCATVELPNEGGNAIAIACEGETKTITLRRVTDEPSVSITAPEEGAVRTDATLTVTGTVGPDVTSVDVNGTRAALSGGTFTASGVRLAAGLNIVVARATNGVGRVASASRRVRSLKDLPSISVTSPAGSMDVSGLWSSLDSSTLVASSGSIAAQRFTDTSGTWTISGAGEGVVTITGRDLTGRVATAAATVTRAIPSVSITAPLDNAVVSTETISVTGTFNAANGSTVEVNGVAASVDGSTFTATVPLAANATPVVARLTEPGGGAATDIVRVLKITTAPKVVETFPARDATDVEQGVLPLVLFSSTMTRASLESALRLETSAGTPVSGTLFVDRDVATFAPAALLAPGGRYTLRVTTAARDLGGNALDSELVTSFTVAGTAPASAPSVETAGGSVCAQQKEIRGTAPAGARVRLDFAGLSLTTTAAAGGAFAFTVPLSGQSGCQVARVRTIGADGSLSPAAEVTFSVDCNGPQVLGATFDRSANRLTIAFSKEIRIATVVAGSSVVVRLGDGRAIAGTIAAASPSSVTFVPAEDLTQRSFSLSVTTAVEDTSGAPLAFAYTQEFTVDVDAEPVAGDGSGFISGEVFDAATGRPLSGATVAVVDNGASTATDARGRYMFRLPEGAYTLALSAVNFAPAWRQVVVRAGAGVTPIDVRLQSRNEFDAQALPGLLPLGWSPLAAMRADRAGDLTFVIDAQEIINAAQTVSAVQYRPDRDEWTVLTPAVNIAIDGKVVVAANEAGAYALVYGDKGPVPARPPAPVTGATLQGVADSCATTSCPPLVASSFVLDPPVVVPSGRTEATLTIDGSGAAVFPSGTAVQASVDEELRLSDGSRVSDPPFTTDLLLYRTPRGDKGVARFHVTPSPRATQVVLDVGFDRIRIIPYPGRVDRGTLVGPEGGKVPGDGSVSVEIPAGAALEPVHASASSIADLSSFGTIAGFRILAGVSLTLQRAQPVEGAAPVTLGESARVTFIRHPVPGTLILVEVLDATPYGRVFRLAARYGTPVDRATLPVDGIVREGRYLLLEPESPIAFATGAVRMSSGIYAPGALVTTPGLGVSDLARDTAIFALAVPARPAAPFALIPRSTVGGAGAAYTHSSSPDPQTVVRTGDLEFRLQPPVLTSIVPANGTKEVVLSPVIKVSFSPAIDPQSVNASSIVVTDTLGQTVPGRVAAEGSSAVVWTLPPGDHLKPNTTYRITVASSIRGPNGVPAGETSLFSFTTITRLVTGDVIASRIRITVPDARGHSRVLGSAGALPPGWNALAVRRRRDFAQLHQAAAAVDGSFAFTIDEPVALTDAIDLRVINAAGSLAAIVPLTPFATADLRGFIAPAGESVTYTTPDGVTVAVPAGAFEKPTTIAISNAETAPFEAVPGFRDELRMSGAVCLDFEGVAKKRIDVAIPVPPGTDPNRAWFLGRLGESVRGPRVEIVDTLRVEGGAFTTTLPPSNGTDATTTTILRNLRPGTNTVSGSQDVKNAVTAAVRSGAYAVVDMQPPMSFGFADNLGSGADLFFDTMLSLYVPTFAIAEKNGRVFIAVPANKPFEVIGVDASTGLEMFRNRHGALQPNDPLGGTTLITVTTPNDAGPYPVFASPARVELIDTAPEGVPVTSVRGLEITAKKPRIEVRGVGSDPATYVGVLSLAANSYRETQSIAGAMLTPDGDAGDRVVISVGAHDVDPDSDVTVVFSRPIDVGPDPDRKDEYIHAKKLIRVYVGSNDVSALARFVADSGDRRIQIDLGLQRGVTYRVVLSKDIAAAPAKGIAAQPALGHDFTMQFSTRAPGGEVGKLTVARGVVRDMVTSGNIALVALAGPGAIHAYDFSNPADLAGTPGDPKLPIGKHEGETDFWTIASDRHGRVYAAGLSAMAGTLYSFRLEDFLRATPTQKDVQIVPAAKIVGGAQVSWRPGVNLGMPIGTDQLISDRPEAYPKKLQVLVQDEETRVTRASLESAPYSAGHVDLRNGFHRISVRVTPLPKTEYYRQRVTVENRTLGARWSADVDVWPSAGSAVIDGVVARENDELVIVHNRTTYGLMSLFGYGIGLYDLNAIEANDIAARANDTEYRKTAEKLLFTKAEGKLTQWLLYPMQRSCATFPPPLPPPPPLPGEAPEPDFSQCVCNQVEAAQAGAPCEIRNLTWSPDALPYSIPNSSRIGIYALDSYRGVLDMEMTPPAGPGQAPSTAALNGVAFTSPYIPPNEGAPNNLIHPRLRPMRDLYFKATGHEPRARYTSISPYTRDDRHYALVASRDYGVLVIRLDQGSLSWTSLVDVIWIPAGAFSVRVIPQSDMAAVTDGAGRVLLVDLCRIDESERVAPMPLCSGPLCAAEPFPTAFKALGLEANPPKPMPSPVWEEVGADDPRILWKSPPHLVNGTMPPIVDPETGFIFTGDVLGTEIRAIAAIDPEVRFMMNRGGPGGYGVATSIVPLGVQPPPGFLDTADPQASAGVFWIEASLPGAITESVPGLAMDLSSEESPGFAAAVRPADFPQTRVQVPLRRVVPESEYYLRFHKAYNRFRSDPIVAIADLRATRAYGWTAPDSVKESLQCFACGAPAAVRSDPRIPELFTAGSYIRAAPFGAFGGSYGFYGTQGRLTQRVLTVGADLVRPSDGATPQDKAAAGSLPTDGIAMEQVVSVNSGEVVFSSSDLGFKGRGLDFALTRFYSSALAYVGPFGRNFDSPLFARIRRLPNGNVEFYDGTGRRDVFEGGVTPPTGVFAAMERALDGQTVVTHPDNTRLYFDTAGRLVKVTDRNTTKIDGSDGNAVLFYYNERGQLASVVDPTGRAVRFAYYSATSPGGYEGCVSSVTDYEGRTVTYRYDAAARLVRVEAPDPLSARSARPVTEYTWNGASSIGSKSALYAGGQIRSESDGLFRTVWDATYNTTYPWAAATVTSGGGAWSFALNADSTNVTDPNGRPWEYVRDADHRVVALKEPGGAATTYAFDSQSRLTSVERPLGDRTTYTYGAKRNLEMITEVPRIGTPERTAGQRRETRIAYGPANLPTTIVSPDGGRTAIVRDARGNPQSVTDPAGVTAAMFYDERGLLRSSTDPRTGSTTYGYESSGVKNGYMKSVTTNAGTTVLEPDSRGNVTKVADAMGRTVTYGFNRLDQMETENRGGSLSTMTYDAAGNLAGRQTLAGVDAEGNPVYSSATFKIDEVGRTREQIDNGRTAQTFYDKAGNVTRLESTGTAPSIYTYDARNRIETLSIGSRTSRHFYDDNSQPSRVQDARGNSTTFITGGFGRSIGQRDALGVERITIVDAANRPIDERVVKTRSDGTKIVLRWTQRRYDIAGRPVEEVRKLFSSPLQVPTDGSDPQGATDLISRWIYDDAGHHVTSIDPNGNSTVTEADDLGRPSRVTDAAGNVRETEYNANGTVASERVIERGEDGETTYKTMFEYDDENRAVAVSDVSDPAHVLRTTMAYDVRGNRIAATDPDGRETRFEYDIRGRLIKTVDAEGGETRRRYDDSDRLVSLTDANGNETVWVWNADGNLDSERRADGATWSYTYDENHNLKTVTDAMGTVTTLVYDSVDRLIEKQIRKAPSVAGPSRVTLTLDDLGRSTSLQTDEGVLETFTYDSLDRPLSEGVQISGGPLRQVSYGYDASSNMTRLSYPSGLSVPNTFDGLNRPLTAGDAVSYTYSGTRLTGKKLSNGVTQSWSYDANARLREIASELDRIQYERTDAGLKTAINRPDLGKRLTYDFNRNGWITRESLSQVNGDEQTPLTSTAYGIDRNLNYTSISRTSPEATTTVTPTVNVRNQYTTFGDQQPRWDANGNLIRLGARVMRYDAANHLSLSSSPDGDLEVTYGGSGRKVRESTTIAGATAVVDYVHSGDRVLEEYRDGVLSARYVRGAGIDEIVRAEVGAATIYPLQDELGNVERLTDAGGAMVERFEYEGYGRFRIFGSDGSGRTSSEWKWLFQGREWQGIARTYDFRARTLWPELSRFGQEDPAGTANHTNLYQALVGDWTANTDPTGRVVVMMHGIRDDGSVWAGEVANALGEQWLRDGADPGQDVMNLVNQKSSRNFALCETTQFCFWNASAAARFGYLDQATRAAGDTSANFFKLLRAQLDASSTRQGEPLQVIAHSHGTSMLLAAAMHNNGRFHLRNALLVGSDIDPYLDISALQRSASMVYNFYSSGDNVVGGAALVIGAGSTGFRDRQSSEYLFHLDPLRLGNGLIQREVEGVGHSASPSARAGGKVSWVGWRMAKTHYAPITAIYDPRRGGEPEAWIRQYDKLRQQMGMAWRIDLPPLYRPSYPRR